MGWFDNEREEQPKPAPPRSTTSDKPAAKAESTDGGSTLGERIHVNGTIVSEENLSIQGRIEGKIRAKGELTVLKGAQVRALIQGRRVRVEGAVEGDILASESVLLGSNAALQGNIKTPQLEIREGALFRGKVEMRSAETSTKTSGKAASAKPDVGTEESKASKADDEDAAEKSEPASGKAPSGTDKEETAGKSS